MRSQAKASEAPAPAAWEEPHALTEVDEAIRLAPRIEAVLAQGREERGTVEDAFHRLADAMEGA